MARSARRTLGCPVLQLILDGSKNIPSTAWWDPRSENSDLAAASGQSDLKSNGSRCDV